MNDKTESQDGIAGAPDKNGGRTRRLQARVRRLAADKSRLELLLHMMTRMSRAGGLENLVERALGIITDVIGATNVALVWVQASEHRYADVYGTRKRLPALDDPMVARAFADGRPLQREAGFEHTRMTYATEDLRAFSWVYPLVLGGEVIGVVKIENTAYSMHGGETNLGVFFNYLAHALKNELLNVGRLKAAYGELEALNAELEERVAARTLALKKANRAFRKSEEKYRLLVENQTDLLVKVDPAGRLEFVSPSYCALFGRKASELLGRPFTPLVHAGDGAPTGAGAMAKIHGPPHCAYVEQRAVTKKGRRTLEWMATAIRDGNGAVTAAVAVGRDVTARKRVEERLRRELALNAAVAEISGRLLSRGHDIGSLADLTLQHAMRLTGSRHGFVSSIDRNSRDHVAHTLPGVFADDCTLDRRDMNLPAGPGGEYDGLWGHALNAGRSFFTNRPARHPSAHGVPEGHIPVENFLAAPAVIDDHVAGLIALANAAGGFSARDARSVERLAEIYALALQRHRYERERAQMERRLRQMQKVEAIGTLAGGIAHDFNNLLFPIVGMAEMLMEDCPPSSAEHQNAREIFNAAIRGSELVKQILAFSRQSEHRLTPVRVHRVLDEALKLARVTIPANVAITDDFRRDGPPVLADASQIQQVVMNLLTNACHAVEATDGEITVTLGEASLAPGGAENGPLAAGDYVRLVVADNGVGMDPGVMERVFEPYFTTKPQGKGTGLGLAVALGIVREHGGDIRLFSEPGRGTTTEVYLPVLARGGGAEPHPPPAADRGGSEHVLFVDDDAAVARLVRQMLERLGYRVSTHTSGVDALQAFAAQPDGFDLVITDMTMPRMTGDRLARKLMAIRPDIPVIVCSGFSERLGEKHLDDIGVRGVLMKPVTRSQLAETVRRVLDAEGPVRRR